MRNLFSFLLLLTIASRLASQAPLRLPIFTDSYLDFSAKNYFQGYFDPSGKMNLKDIDAAAFVPFDSLDYPRGILRNNDCRIWLRCRVDSLSCPGVDSTPLYWHFNLRQTMVEGFRVGEDGQVKHFEWGYTSNGEQLPTLFLLPFEQSGQAAATWYFRIQPFPFRIKDFSPRLLSIKGWRDRSAVRYYDMRTEHNITVCLAGIIIFVSLFTFMQWALYRLQVFLFYGCFLLSCLANLYRYEMEFAVPVTNLTAFLTTHGDYIATYLGHTFYFLFINKFLKLNWRMPGLYRLTRWSAVFSGILITVHFLVFYLLNRHDWAHSIYLLRFALLLVALYSLIAIIHKRPPFYVFIFWGGVSVASGALVWIVSGFRIENGLSAIPHAAVAFYIGVMLETLFFLSGLGYQFKISEESKRNAQKKLLDERERITRDLHDDVGSTLNSLAVMSELARRQSKNLPIEVVKTLDTIQSTARDTVQRISDIVWSVNPNIETVGELIARMRNFTFSLFAGTNTRVRFSVADSHEMLLISAEHRWQLYLIFKEAVNNVRKYAGASLLRIELKEEGGKMRLSVSDNGQGFDPAHAQNGNGLRTMQERADVLGGTVLLRSVAGEGTVVEIDWLL